MSTLAHVAAAPASAAPSLPSRPLGAVRAMLTRWAEIARIERELRAYSDRELDDLGIRRVDIPEIARSAV